MWDINEIGREKAIEYLIRRGYDPDMLAKSSDSQLEDWYAAERGKKFVMTDPRELDFGDEDGGNGDDE